MKPTLVKLERPPESDRISDELCALAARAQAGEFCSIFVVAVRPDGRWLTVELGNALHPLTKIGIMENIKVDIINATKVE